MQVDLQEILVIRPFIKVSQYLHKRRWKNDSIEQEGAARDIAWTLALNPEGKFNEKHDIYRVRVTPHKILITNGKTETLQRSNLAGVTITWWHKLT